MSDCLEILPPNQGVPPQLMVLLHGVGADAASMLPLARALQHEFPQAALLIPEGVAHGFLTLEADSDILYQISPAYDPGHEAGVRWDDPAFAIRWPQAPMLISERDASYPDH